MKSIQEFWVTFAAAALQKPYHDAPAAAKIADEMLEQFAKRWGESARILAGIMACYYCQKPVGDDFVATDGKDGEFKKFCRSCVETTEKTGKAPSNPGIAHCDHCGQDTRTIFSCPGETEPVLTIIKDNPTKESLDKLNSWRELLRPRGSGNLHSFEAADAPSP